MCVLLCCWLSAEELNGSPYIRIPPSSYAGFSLSLVLSFAVFDCSVVVIVVLW